MFDYDKRIRINKSVGVGNKNGEQVFYIEGCYPKDDNDPVVLPTVGVATGSFLEEVESGMVKQFSEDAEGWIDQGTIQTIE